MRDINRIRDPTIKYFSLQVNKCVYLIREASYRREEKCKLSCPWTGCYLQVALFQQFFSSFLVAMGDANEVSIGQKVVTTCCYYSNWKTINYILFLLHKLSLTADFVLAHCYFFQASSVTLSREFLVKLLTPKI